ncbi:uncharacterized protein LOC124843891 [Vigna umbellata]|uniref:uncharacterized protein LOC124843891 n=1 Tax=Vigna umbellata TaxID=87088 RepID=UPI001F5E85E7|nr:uncharacterized protein LOC124843891 [Vigna umbellata]
MPKRFPHVFSNKNLFKHLQSTTPITVIVSSSGFCIPNADAQVHTQGGDSIVGAAAEGAVNATEAAENVGERAKETVNAAKKTAECVAESTMAEADTNVVDTAEYRCSEDLGGHLGDGHDSYS